MKEIYYMKGELLKEKLSKKEKKLKEKELPIKDINKEKAVYNTKVKQLTISQISLTVEKAYIDQDKNKNEFLMFENKKYIKSAKRFIKIFSEVMLNSIYSEFCRCTFHNYKTIDDYNKIIYLYENEKNYILLLPSVNLRGKQMVEVYEFQKKKLSEYLG
jgi:hypothetical protein